MKKKIRKTEEKMGKPYLGRLYSHVRAARRARAA